MPTGKARMRGAHIKRPDLSGLDVRTDFLEANRRLTYRAPVGEPTSETLASIRYAVETYLGSHRAAPPMTLTSRRKILRHLARVVRRAIKSPNDAEAVRDAEVGLKNLDLNTRDELYRFLTAAAREGRLPRYAPMQFLRGANGKADWLPLVIDYCAVRSKASAWADPYLVHLVFDLAPAWRLLTGRTLRAEDEAKNSLLGEWVAMLVNDAAPKMKLARPASAVEHVLRLHKGEK